MPTIAAQQDSSVTPSVILSIHLCLFRTYASCYDIVDCENKTRVGELYCFLDYPKNKPRKDTVHFK